MAHPPHGATAIARRTRTRAWHAPPSARAIAAPHAVRRPGLWRWIWPLLAVGLAHLVAVNAIALRWAPQEANYRHVQTVAQYPRMLTPDDSWKVMELALRQLGDADPTPIYSAVFFRDQRRFQYPLTSLLPLAAVRRLVPERFALHVPLNVISMLALGASALLLPHLLTLGLRDAGVARFATGTPAAERRPLTRLEHAMLAAFALLLAVTFYPVIFALRLGQIQVWLNALFVGVLWCWLTGRKREAGALTALICLVKPQLALLFVWGMLRREWTFVRAGLTVGALGGAAAIAAWGFADNLDYLGVLSFLGRTGDVYLPNQSPNGLLNRLMIDMDPNVWHEHHFTPFDRVVLVGTSASSAALAAGALAWPWLARRRRGAAHAAGGTGSALDLCIAVVSFTIASPIAWQHHYGVLLPIFVYVLALGASRRPLGRATVPCLGAAYLLVANDFMDVVGCRTGMLGAVLQSYLLWGALLLLAVLYVHVTSHRPPAATA